MGRDRKKGDDRRRDAAPEVEVLIAHDPMLGFDSDDDLDLTGGNSNVSLGNRERRDSSHSGTSGGKEKQKRKRNKKKKETVANEDGVDDEEVFYVEKIKEKRWNLGRWEYLLKWQGYDDP